MAKKGNGEGPARDEARGAGIQTTRGGTPAPKERAPMAVGELVARLKTAFPPSTAEEWDRNGLLVGDPAQQVRGVAVALDPTARAVDAAAERGANVLLTHHPAFLDAPTRLRPPGSDGAMGPEAAVWEAVRRGVALVNFHTPLDVSKPAARVLPGMLHLELVGVVDVSVPDEGLGYGQSCRVRDADAPMDLGQLAARCTSVFGRPPRVWGDMSERVERVATATGSTGDLLAKCVKRGFDCLVCGEVHYHDALAASQAGLAVVELGHDVSELPLCAVLMSAARSAGVGEGAVCYLDQGSNWSVPETVRQ